MTKGDRFKNMTEDMKARMIKYVEDNIEHKVYKDKHIDKIGLYSRCGTNKWTTIEVGECLDRQIAGPHDEEVAAIFETDGEYYVVCTPNHGMEKGRPYIFRDQEIYMVVEE